MEPQVFRELKSFFELTVVVLFAGECVYCRKLLKECAPLCDECGMFQRMVPPLCLQCGSSLSQEISQCGHCEKYRFTYLKSVRSLFWLSPEASAVIHGIKFRGHLGFLPYLREKVFSQPIPLREKNTVLVPVPLTSLKQMSRGFNQALEIAWWFSQWMGLPVLDGLLKVRETAAQSTLGKRDRQKNLKRAFQWDNRLEVPQKIILVDDILTTGRTLETCAQLMVQRGATQVEAITLFRTPLRAFEMSSEVADGGQSIHSAGATMVAKPSAVDGNR